MTTSELPDGVTVETVYAVEISYSPEAQAKRPAVRLEHLSRVARLLREGTLVGPNLDRQRCVLERDCHLELCALGTCQGHREPQRVMRFVACVKPDHDPLQHDLLSLRLEVPYRWPAGSPPDPAPDCSDAT